MRPCKAKCCIRTASGIRKQARETEAGARLSLLLPFEGYPAPTRLSVNTKQVSSSCLELTVHATPLWLESLREIVGDWFPVPADLVARPGARRCYPSLRQSLTSRTNNAPRRQHLPMIIREDVLCCVLWIWRIGKVQGLLDIVGGEGPGRWGWASPRGRKKKLRRVLQTYILNEELLWRPGSVWMEGPSTRGL